MNDSSGPDGRVDPAGSNTSVSQDDVRAVLEANLDRAFYHATYRDVRDAGMDAVEHFQLFGWRERRRPTPWFDTRWYCIANHDVEAAGVNPFWHYLTIGAAEGRLPQPRGSARQRTIARAERPARRNVGYVAPADATVLSDSLLDTILARMCDGMRGLAVAVSHDRYIDSTGGIQILLSDEQRLFAGDRIAHLHLSPAIARLTLVPPDSGSYWVQVTVAGRFQGLASSEAVAASLGRLPPAAAPVRILTLHSLLGHDIAAIVALARALHPVASFIWLHDYSTLCEGFHLLRNDVTFCHAPPPDSMACRVCIYGESRVGHLARLSQLFTAVPLHVIAPSRAARDLWIRSTTLPYRAVLVHPNCRFLTDPQPAASRPTRGEPDDPARIAFVGHPLSHKGWSLYAELVHRMRAVGRYRFYHLAAEEAPEPIEDVIHIPTAVTTGDRFAAVNELARHQIDLVAILSAWPETFCYVAFEAFAAGCDVIALADSGNVADVVRQHHRGAVFPDEDALLDYFASGAAADHASQRQVWPGRLDVTGTTATVDPARETPPGSPAPRTTDPALQLWAAGERLELTRQGATYTAQLPGGAGQIRLLSRFVTQDMAGTGQRRGVAIASLALDGEHLPPGDKRWTSGWHPADTPGLFWTDGDATLAPQGATRLSFTVIGTRAYPASLLGTLR